MKITTVGVPDVWVGCIACYNASRLVGDWYPADDIPESVDDFNIYMRRDGRDLPKDHIVEMHEEIWVYDHELRDLINGECSPTTAAETWALVEDMDSDRRHALGLWRKNITGTSDQLTAEIIQRFDDEYQGCAESEQAFAMDWAENCGYLSPRCPRHTSTHRYCEACEVAAKAEWLTNHIDWESVVQSLENDGGYTFIHDDGEVYVFNSNV